MPKRFENPVEIPPNVLEGLEDLRASGVAYMVDYASVQAAAARLGYPEVVIWLEFHQREYREGLVHGFVAEE
jgi:hypothetical protein